MYVCINYANKTLSLCMYAYEEDQDLKCMFMYICMHVCMYVCMHVCLYIYKH